MTLKEQHRRWIGAGIGLLLTAALGVGLSLGDLRERDPRIASDSPKTLVLIRLLERLTPGQNLIHLSYDLPFLWRPIKPPEELVLVHLDDRSHSALGQPYDSSWDRGLYGRLIERLTAEHARAVGFDMVFSTTNLARFEGDERFARALKANGKTILGAELQRSVDEGTHDLLADGGKIYRACDLLFDASAGYGLVQITQDQDFVVRRHFHVPYEEGQDIHSSLSWQVARIAGTPVAQDDQQRWSERWVNYYGPPNTIPERSFVMVLDTNNDCPAGFFSNKVVLVGSSVKTSFSGQRKDEVRTPFTKLQEFVPAVDTQATITLNLLRGDWLRRAPLSIEVLIMLLAAVLFGAGLSLFRPLPAVGLALAGALAVALTANTAFQRAGLWFPWMIIVAAQIPVALLWSVAFNSVHLYIQNQLYVQSLQVYLPENLVRKFSSNRDLLKPGAHKQVLTLFFSDIADFTSLSEDMDSEELAHLMNAYFHIAVRDCIHKTGGTVAKFIGDGIFAFWNAPDTQPDNAARACEAALYLAELSARPINGRTLHTRIGLHTGLVNVGNFGGEDRVDYTAIGNNVNLASRLEGMNKFLGTRCLISAETKAEIGDLFATRRLGGFRVKGLEAVVQVHELVGTAEQDAKTRPWRETFAQALDNYEQRNLEFAQLGFRQVLDLHPGDGPAQFYLKQIAERGAEFQASDSWATYTVFKDK